MVRRSLAEGLGIANEPSVFVTFRDARTGLAYIRSSRELWERGLWLALDAYQGHVFWEFDEVHDGTAGQWRRLADRLNGAGVPSLEDALVEQQLAPVHAPLRALFEGGHVAATLDGTAGPGWPDAMETRLAEVLVAVAAATGVAGDASATAARIREDAEAAFRGAGAGGGDGTGGKGAAVSVDTMSREDRAALLLYVVLSRSGALAPGADVRATSLAWYDELRLAPVLAEGLRSAGLDDEAAHSVADTVRVLLALPRPSELRGRGRARDLRLLEQWLAREPVRQALGVNTSDGTEWLDRDRLAALLSWALRLDAIETGALTDTALADRLLAAAEAAGYRVDRLQAALGESLQVRRDRDGRPLVDRPTEAGPRPGVPLDLEPDHDRVKAGALEVRIEPAEQEAGQLEFAHRPGVVGLCPHEPKGVAVQPIIDAHPALRSSFTKPFIEPCLCLVNRHECSPVDRGCREPKRTARGRASRGHPPT